MKALTIQGPWVHMIAYGAKPYEFRKWRPDSHVGEKLVVHASVKKIDDDLLWQMAQRLREGKEGYGFKRLAALNFFDMLCARLVARLPLGLPLGAGLGTARLGVPRRVKDLYDPDCDFTGVSDYLYAWPLEEFEPFAAPVKCMGAQGLWNWPGEVASVVPEPNATYRPGVA